MPNPDVLAAIHAAIEGAGIFPFMDEREVADLSALAADIKAYREACRSLFVARNRVADAVGIQDRAKARRALDDIEYALLARCRGEQPSTTP
jgi:hypothetical protein